MKRKFSEKIFYTTFLRFQPAGRYEHEVFYCSYVILCQKKCETTNHELYRKHKVDLSDIPFVNGIGIGHGAGVISSEEAS